MQTIPIIDGDIIAYSCAAITDGKSYSLQMPDSDSTIETTKKRELNILCDDLEISRSCIQELYTPEPIANTCNAMKLMLKQISESLGAQDTELRIYLSDTYNYRYDVFTEYKQNRVGQRRPENLSAAKDYLIKHWDAEIWERLECDDVLGIEQTKHNSEVLHPSDCPTVLCTLDKDLDMIPGWHYNWRKKEKYWVDEEEAIRHFYTQLITGDKTDNIPGLGEKSPKRRTFPTKPLEKLTDEQQMFDYVFKGYVSKYKDAATEHMAMNGDLLWILREKDQLWSHSREEFSTLRKAV